MKFRKETAAESEGMQETREEVRELAEALSLYRSAMHHVAERQLARPWTAPRRPARTMRLGLLLTPVLAAAIAAGVLIPMYSHHGPTKLAGPQGQTTDARTASPDVARADEDTVLMNQIDSELSEDVPDALRPLADLSDESTSNASVRENKNVTQE